MLDIQKQLGSPKIIETNLDERTASFEITNLPR
jgi:hypothetical protein